MSTIWKYELELTDRQQVIMPTGATILCVQTQLGNLCLWAQVDPNAKKEERHIAIVGTGHPIHRNAWKYIGTAQQAVFVWHVFEIPPIKDLQ